jgi:hypothetical protein
MRVEFAGINCEPLNVYAAVDKKEQRMMNVESFLIYFEK